nr:transglycosylase SLT domain protein [uncultured Mediterranean phage uvMED]|tara:strand:- start:166 stop:2337 length:2172 start_codon:yes stop_codon:yes gene_type:complete
MPKIPKFISEARITEQSASVKSNIQIPLSQTIGNALAPVTKAITKHAIAEKDLENKTEALKLENESLLELTDVFEEASRLDNKDQALQLVQSKSKTIQDKYANLASNKAVQNSFNNSYLGEVQKGIFKVNTRVSKNVIQSLDNEVSKTKNRLLTEAFVSKNPLAIAELKNDLEFLYEKTYKSRIDVDAYDKLILNIPNEISVFEASQEISNNPKQAYLNLMDGTKYPDLDVNKRIQLVNEVKSVLVPEIRENYKNFAAAASVGKKIPFDLKFAKEILRPKEYQKIIQEHGAIVETVDNVNIINSVSAKDLSKVTDDFINDAEQKYPFIKSQKIKKIYTDAVKNRNEAMAKDPVLFLTQTDDNLKILVEELAVETNPDMIVKKKLALTDVIVQKQIDMGQPNYQVKVMSQSQADSFVTQYMNGDQNMRVAMLQNLNSEFGTYNSQAMLQLSEAGLPVTAELSSFFNNPKVTEKFLSFDEKDEQDRLKQFAKDNNINFNTLRKDVRDNLKDFEGAAMRGSAFNNSVALEKIDNIVETLTFYTLSGMVSGKSENAARKEAVNLINGSFNVQETFFIPLIYDGKSIASSADFIAEKANLIKDFYLQDFGAVAFQSMDEDVTEVELTEAMTDQMKNFGEWRNKSDGSGIIYGIVFNDGSFGPVVNRDGENLEFNFDDTTLSIPGTDKDIDVEIRTKSQELDPRGAYLAVPESIKRQEENKQVKLTRTR